VELAYDYLAEAALMDLDDLEHNTRDGLHIASLAGAWIGAVAGLGGMRDHDGSLSFAPRLPEALDRLAFRLSFRGRRLLVEIRDAQALYELAEGAPLELLHHGEPMTLAPGPPLTLPVPPAPRLERPVQPPGRAPARRRPPV
jgi:alpha,alpha-trehalose phosphorylase